MKTEPKKKAQKVVRGWAVVCESQSLIPDDIFLIKRNAEKYKRDCFDRETKAKIVRTEITYTI